MRRPLRRKTYTAYFHSGNSFSIYKLPVDSFGKLFTNHLSGNLKTGLANEQLTQKIKEAGKYLDLPVMDHLIITGEDGYYSFADEGLL